jgi:hypothetical protein
MRFIKYLEMWSKTNVRYSIDETGLKVKGGGG